MPDRQAVIHAVKKNHRPILDDDASLDPLVDFCSDKRVVMLGEATHGTHEFYELRRRLSMRLIREHGFDFIAVEGDWPPCYEVSAYLDSNGGRDPRQVLSVFERWPTWMWANEEVSGLVLELRQWNHRRERRPDQRATAFYGLDVYSFFESVARALERVETINPFAARRLREHYACLEPYRGREATYARSLLENPEGCEDEVVAALKELLELRLDGIAERDEALFDVRQNARIVHNAEKYYRAMVSAGDSSWNVRDEHMMETLEALLERRGRKSKAIVWAHNTHIGDYRATDMVRSGLVNIGGLARERFGPSKVALIGFGSYEGNVIASPAWEGPVTLMSLPPARRDSIEEMFHAAVGQGAHPAFFIELDNLPPDHPLDAVIPHRAVGVVYEPANERYGNYVPTRLSERYDGFIHVDSTRALVPLIEDVDRGEMPEAFPSGF